MKHTRLNTTLCLIILWCFGFLLCFIHKYTFHTKYKLQSYRNLKIASMQIIFILPSSRLPLLPLDNTAIEELNLSTLSSMTLLHMCSYFICNILKRGSYDTRFFRVANAFTFIKVLWVIKGIFLNTISISLNQCLGLLTIGICLLGQVCFNHHSGLSSVCVSLFHSYWLSKYSITFIHEIHPMRSLSFCIIVLKRCMHFVVKFMPGSRITVLFCVFPF